MLRKGISGGFAEFARFAIDFAFSSRDLYGRVSRKAVSLSLVSNASGDRAPCLRNVSRSTFNMRGIYVELFDIAMGWSAQNNSQHRMRGNSESLRSEEDENSRDSIKLPTMMLRNRCTEHSKVEELRK
jgi:hypothetical protein